MPIRIACVAPAAAAVLSAALCACAPMTPTRETTSGYAIFDIPAAPGLTHARIAEALRGALQKNMSQVQIHNGIPPSLLPEKAPRFQLVSPLRGTTLAALAGASAQSMQLPTCEGAITTAHARDSAMARYGEATTFFVCLMPYQAGWSLNVYTTFSKASGAFSAATLGATLARSVVGDSSQFIPRTIASIVEGINATGARAALVEAYP